MVFNNISLLSYKMRELNLVSCKFSSSSNILCFYYFFPGYYKLYISQVPSPSLQAAQPLTCRLKIAPGSETQWPNLHIEPYFQELNCLLISCLVPYSSGNLIASLPSHSSQDMQAIPEPYYHGLVSTTCCKSSLHRPPAGLDTHCLPAASLRALSHQPGHLSSDHGQASQMPATHLLACLTVLTVWKPTLFSPAQLSWPTCGSCTISQNLT